MTLFFRSPTLRACPQCQEMRLLKDFRRWRGRQRVLHDTCNFCDPEKRLSEMSAEQRATAIDADRPRARVMVVEAMEDRMREERRQATSRDRLAYHAKVRRAAWREGIGKRLAEEHDWAKRSLSSARTAGALGAAWVEFFEAYAQVLRLMRERVEVLAERKYAPTTLTPEDRNPCTYAYPETRQSLRLLYSACRPIPHRRTYRDPWFLVWGQET